MFTLCMLCMRLLNVMYRRIMCMHNCMSMMYFAFHAHCSLCYVHSMHVLNGQCMCNMYEVHVLNMNPFPLLTGFACKVSSGFEFQVKSCLFWKLVLIWSCHPHHSNRGQENYWKSWVQIPATERWFVCPFTDYFQILHKKLHIFVLNHFWISYLQNFRWGWWGQI